MDHALIVTTFNYIKYKHEIFFHITGDAMGYILLLLYVNYRNGVLIDDKSAQFNEYVVLNENQVRSKNLFKEFILRKKGFNIKFMKHLHSNRRNENKN